jgi:hypothetical protein
MNIGDTRAFIKKPVFREVNRHSFTKKIKHEIVQNNSVSFMISLLSTKN